MAGRPGFYNTAAHTEATIGVATGAALAANDERVYVLFINDSDTTIYLRLGEAAVLNQGIRVNANGGSFEMTQQQGNLFDGVVNGISSGASKNLLVLEGTN